MKHQIKWKKHIFHVKNEQGILGSVPTELSKISRTYHFHPLKFLSGNVPNNVESETIRPLLISPCDINT